MEMQKVLIRLWDRWKRIAHAIGRFQTRLLLSLFYFLVISPLGLLMRLFRWDPLATSPRKAAHPSNWKPVADPEPDLDSLRRQS